MLHTHEVARSSRAVSTFFFWPVGQVVKTPPFHGGNMGSSPVRVTKSRLSLHKTVGVFFFPSRTTGQACGPFTFLFFFKERKSIKRNSVHAPKVLRNQGFEPSNESRLFIGERYCAILGAGCPRRSFPLRRQHGALVESSISSQSFSKKGLTTWLGYANILMVSRY